MNVLITGGSGFIGSHLAEYLLQYNPMNITILDRLDSTASLDRLSFFHTEKNKSRVKFVWWDLKSEFNNSIKNQLSDIDIVIHAAASSHVDRSIINPLEFVMDNTVGTCNLLNWIKDNPKIRLLVHCSTDEVFGSAINQNYEHTDATFPENPYAATKAGAESLVISYACTYKIRAVIIRMTNVVGIRQHPEKFIPLVIRKILLDETVEIHSDKNKVEIGTRYYIDVQDICNAIWHIISNALVVQASRINKEKRWSGIYHVSGLEEVSNLFIAKLISFVIGKELKYKLVPYPSNRPYHDLKYSISDTTMRDLNWWPSIAIDSSIVSIVNWYLKNQEWLEI